ncbi:MULTISPECIES: hypothetical protein [unclassified Neorhizobium]|uniref:hypothetical protein n=1 Tax=unclassified Neorhizobium TaxID=2629175 RepID=UPI001FF586FD|nr:MULTISPECIES: hypothetical protein [unclassified Neorhizobium]MCJ9669354.1 hypothetical protein [Neorhizobium sp. SHOUNA12B]MCJ9743822.1 hypothetical protein [Neorhizobium sp. SHOUNA12A]
MKKFLGCLAVIACGTLLSGEPAAAISRYNSTGMSCAAVQRAIGREGAVILRYPSRNKARMTLYDRYVIDSGYCDSHEFADRATVPTADTPSCPVRACKRRPDPEDCFPLQAGCLRF